MRNDFYIKRPKGTHKSWSIIQREKGKATSLKSDTIAAVNSQYLAGKMTWDEALEALRREVKRLRATHNPTEQKVTLLNYNRRLLARYWNEVYEHKDIIAKDAAYNRLRRAMEALRDTPITAPKEELQKAIAYLAPKKQRSVVSVINQLLRFVGRPEVKLSKTKKPRTKVAYLTLPEFEKMVAFIPLELKAFYWSAFCTGARTGELFALNDRSFHDGILTIEEQVDRNLVTRDTKNGRSRKVVVLPIGIPWLKKWIDVSDKESIRNRRFSDITKAACKKAFPDNKTRWIKFHDLRHSYAIHLLGNGVSLGLVAQSLGDSEAVAAEHYVGFELSPVGINHIKKLIEA